MEKDDFAERIEQLVRDDPRYSKGAYFFLHQALDFTVKRLRKKGAKPAGRSRHVTGQQLLEGFRDCALEEYGPMAFTVLSEWGLHRCEDVGEIVYNLIEHGIFNKTESDRKEDFSAIYSFEEAFRKPFEPERIKFTHLVREDGTAL